MANKKKCAVIGYGGIGKWHTRYMLASDVVELCGIYDINPAKAAEAEANGIHAYASLDELLSDEQIEFVTIATPNELHKPLAIEAMSKGKHVISEKPVTLSSTDLQEIFDAAKKYGKLFTTHQNRRYDVDYLMMKQVYASGELGEVFGVESRIQGSRGIPGDWRGKKEHGGGMILDWGVHLIDQMLGIINDKLIEKVYCVCDHITNSEVDDGFKLDLMFEGGLVAHIEVGTSHFISLPRFYMTGTNGSAIINDWRDKTKIVCCKNWEEKDVVPVVTAAGLTKTMAPRDGGSSIVTTDLPRFDYDRNELYRNFVEVCRGAAPQIVTQEHALRVLKLMEACFESSETGKAIAFEA